MQNKRMENKTNSVDAYIAKFPGETQKLLHSMRDAICKTVPRATEVISYGIPTFKLKGNLVHFAAYKNHIGFYPGAKALLNFKTEIANYKSSKGAVQFPINQELPFDLIEKITLFCVREKEEV